MDTLCVCVRPYAPPTTSAWLLQFSSAAYYFHTHIAQSPLHRYSPNTGTLGCLPLKTSSWSALTFQGIISNYGEIAAEYFMRFTTSHTSASVATVISEVSAGSSGGEQARASRHSERDRCIQPSPHRCRRGLHFEEQLCHHYRLIN